MEWKKACPHLSCFNAPHDPLPSALKLRTITTLVAYQSIPCAHLRSRVVSCLLFAPSFRHPRSFSSHVLLWCGKEQRKISGIAAPVTALQEVPSAPTVVPAKKPWWHLVTEPGSAVQIIIAAVSAIAIGLPISSTQDVPDEAMNLLAIPGNLWLRALTCVSRLMRGWAPHHMKLTS